mmetsp:Transcript_13148/g.23862  ORF Transcript_13148/g.23862 Transcript_13148/m.23862 type:complete len:107 (-) Transcript_13148:259-579(-)
MKTSSRRRRSTRVYMINSTKTSNVGMRCKREWRFSGRNYHTANPSWLIFWYRNGRIHRIEKQHQIIREGEDRKEDGAFKTAIKRKDSALPAALQLSQHPPRVLNRK